MVLIIFLLKWIGCFVAHGKLNFISWIYILFAHYAVAYPWKYHINENISINSLKIKEWGIPLWWLVNVQV